MSTFEKLWKNFPSKTIIKTKCTNKQPTTNKPFTDYCAIMLSDCLIKSGINTSSFAAKKCWSHPGRKHTLLAEELAHDLAKRPPPGFSRMKKVPAGSFQSQLSGKTGVIFFKDYWQRGKESFASRSGDHIDLWNENKITGSSMFVRSVYEFFGAVSDLNKSKEVWFWEVK